MMQPLNGYTSAENAFIVTDYPMGFRARGPARFWVEHSERYGWRLARQTVNPRGKWNNPAYGTYSSLGGGMCLDEKNHVQFLGIGEASKASAISEFIGLFPDAVTDKLRAWCRDKARYTWGYSQGMFRWVVNGTPVETSPADKLRAFEEFEQWRTICNELGVSFALPNPSEMGVAAKAKVEHSSSHMGA